MPHSAPTARSLLLAAGVVLLVCHASAAVGPAYPPRLPGYYSSFYNRAIVGDPATSVFSLVHAKNGVDENDNRHMAILLNTADNSTEYNLIQFSQASVGSAYFWRYYAATSCARRDVPAGQKRPGLLQNAIYLGRSALNNGVSTQEVDMWNATAKLAGADQPFRFAQTVGSGGIPFNIHFYRYPTDDTWFVDWTDGDSATSKFAMPLSFFTPAMLPADCPASTSTSTAAGASVGTNAAQGPDARSVALEEHDRARVAAAAGDSKAALPFPVRHLTELWAAGL